MKRLAFLWLTVIVAVYFCFTCFFCPSISASASGGGGSHRGDYINLNRSDIDVEKTEGEISGSFWGDIFGGNGKEVLDDLFCYAIGSVGAIFSDDTTLSGVKNQWNAIYANALESPEEMRKIFYYGKDGQLYFTDDFIATTKNIVDQASFENGVFSVPFCTSDSVYQKALSFGILYLTNAVTSCLSGDDARLMNCCYSTPFKNFNDGFSITGLYPVLTFNDYSSYLAFCDHCVSNVPTFFYKYSNGPVLLSLPESILPWSSVPDRDGNFNRINKSPFNFDEGQSKFLVGNPASVDNSPSCFFAGVGTFEAYRSSDWLDFYMSGGTGVLRGNTYYKFDNAINTDEMANGSAIYKQLQEQYKTLAGDVKAGTKTLSEINQILSDEILDTAKDIEQNTAVQANYLKKILNEVKDISKKLTYSNVVDTVGAAASLFDALSNAFDGLFSDDNSVVSSLTDLLNDKLKSEFSSRFPFSVYRDFEIIVNSLAHEPVEPPLEYRLYLPRYNIDYVFNFSTSVDSGGGHRVDFDSFKVLSDIMHFFSSVIFVYGLFNVTMDYVNSFKE